MTTVVRCAMGALLAGACAALAAAMPACSSVPPAPSAAMRPATPAAGEALSPVEGTAGTGPVTYSREPLGGRDNAATPPDNTLRVIPFHKAPPPREVPN